MIDRKVVKAGVPGEVSKAGVARLPKFLKKIQPDLLILCHGGNDFLQKRKQERTRQNVRKMVQMAKDRGIDVLLIGVPAPGLWLSVPEFYQKIADEFKIPYEGQALKEILSNSSLKSDVIHPNARGYKQLANAIAALLKTSGGF